MQNLEEIKKNWKVDTEQLNSAQLDEAAWQNLLKRQVKKQKNMSMPYFWASLTFQIIIYGFLTHVIIKYWGYQVVLLPSVFCLLLYVPFTVVLMLKFKRMAVLKQNEKHATDLAIKEYVLEQSRLLTSFYTFKMRYEIVLVPLSSAIFVWIFFELYLPGGATPYPRASVLLFILILGACTAAILAENKKNFKKPLKQLEEILKDINASKTSNRF